MASLAWTVHAIQRPPWVCAYANNQHELAADIPADPKDSAFFKAMELSEGVLVVMDSKAIVFTRIWCGFEQATAVRHAKLLLDFATVHGGRAHLLTERFAYKNEGKERKAARERSFPLELLEAGYELDISSAQASEEKDRRHILNSIDGKDQ